MIVQSFRLAMHFPLGEAGAGQDRNDLEQQAEVKILRQVRDAGWEPILGTFAVRWESGRAVGEATVLASKGV